MKERPCREVLNDADVCLSRITFIFYHSAVRLSTKRGTERKSSPEIRSGELLDEPPDKSGLFMLRSLFLLFFFDADTVPFRAR